MTRKEWVQSKSKRARNRRRSNNRDANRILKKIRMSYSRIGGCSSGWPCRVLACLHLITRSAGLALLSDILKSGQERSRGWGVWGGGERSLLCQRPRLWCRVLRQAWRMCAVAGYFSRCSSGITRWSLRALFDGGSLLLRLW